MHIVRHADADFAAQLDRAAAASSLFDPVIEQRARAIVDDVRARGDAALAELTERFDGAKLTPAQFAVTTAELLGASLAADEPFAAGLRRVLLPDVGHWLHLEDPATVLPIILDGAGF